MMMPYVFQLSKVGRQFGREPAVQALIDIDLCLAPGEWLAITGPSGAGKSTLLNIIGCLDCPTHGSYHFATATAPVYAASGLGLSSSPSTCWPIARYWKM